MTREPHDDLSLETELAALRPAAPPPALRRRIADELAPIRVTPTPPRNAPRAPAWLERAWPLAAAAGLGLVLTLMPLADPSAPTSTPTHADAIHTTADAASMAQLLDAPTSLWSYHRALGESPQTLDALLDRHGRDLLPPTSAAALAGLYR